MSTLTAFKPGESSKPQAILVMFTIFSLLLAIGLHNSDKRLTNEFFANRCPGHTRLPAPNSYEVLR